MGESQEDFSHVLDIESVMELPGHGFELVELGMLNGLEWIVHQRRLDI